MSHTWLLDEAKANPPENPTNTVSSFAGWVFRLCHPTRSLHDPAVKLGKYVEHQIEQSWRSRRQGLERDANIDTDLYRLEFADPLDGSKRGLRISALTLHGEPLYGLPDVVFRDEHLSYVGTWVMTV